MHKRENHDSFFPEQSRIVIDRTSTLNDHSEAMGRRPRSSNGTKRKKKLDALDVQIGTRIAGMREERGLTQVQLGAVARISQTKVSYIERGIDTCKPAFLISLANALRVHPCEILGLPKH